MTDAGQSISQELAESAESDFWPANHANEREREGGKNARRERRVRTRDPEPGTRIFCPLNARKKEVKVRVKVKGRVKGNEGRTVGSGRWTVDGTEERESGRRVRTRDSEERKRGRQAGWEKMDRRLPCTIANILLAVSRPRFAGGRPRRCPLGDFTADKICVVSSGVKINLAPFLCREKTIHRASKRNCAHCR
jgi:hypothetical protein